MQLTSQRGRQGKVDDAGGVVAQIDERHQRPTRPTVHSAGVRSAYHFGSRLLVDAYRGRHFSSKLVVYNLTTAIIILMAYLLLRTCIFDSFRVPRVIALRYRQSILVIRIYR